MENPAESLTLVNSSTATTIPEIPHITEPTLRADIAYDSNGNPFLPDHDITPSAGGGHGRDLSFDFGDFGHASSTAPVSQPGIPASAGPETTLPYRDYIPQQQQQHPQQHDYYSGQQDYQQYQPQYQPRSDSYHAKPPPGPGAYDDAGDWPQEALMYQSAFGEENRGQDGARRNML
jgi:hypothetical protein